MADVERERVTALWREAAAALEPGNYFRDPESGEYVYAPDKPAAPKPCAECGRLRGQLDAAADYIASALTSLETGPGKDAYAYALLCAARAALGVEGEQEKP